MTSPATPSHPIKTTPLHSRHAALKARLVPFAGWEMPIQYSSILDEHAAVRTASGVFDISHMGQLHIRGTQAETWLDRMLTNNVASLPPGKGHYSFLLNDIGGVVDDLFVYRLEKDEFLIVVNASMADTVLKLFTEDVPTALEITDLRPVHGAIAVQGPDAPAKFAALFPDGPALPDARNSVLRDPKTGICVARTGYTGEDGFEVFAPNEIICQLWDKAIAAGVKPCGLGARDTLRLEVCYPLNGSDLHPDRTPLEAGLGWAVDLNKPSFIGRSALVVQKEVGLRAKLAAFKMIDAGAPPRPHYPVLHGGEVIGEVSSGTLSPSLKQGIGMAYLPAEVAKVDTEIEIDVRGKKLRAVVVKKPFYKKYGASYPAR